MSDKKYWDPEFTPSYTPMEMLDLGVFEGIYTYAIKDIPAKYKNHKNVLKDTSKPDIEINRFKVKSRQSLKVWQEKGWTTELSPLGSFEWFVKYFEGRRDEKEDKLQIGRWKSFVARHQGQIKANCSLTDHKCRPAQRQALLQWFWDSDTNFTEEQRQKNLKRILKITGCSVKSTAKESIPIYVGW